MKIAIAGATGFLGSALSKQFLQQGYSVVPLVRKLFDDNNRQKLIYVIEGCDVVINLAGKSLLGRWTKRHKEEVYKSRVLLTRALVEAINATQTPPSLFISASATGYYSSGKIHSEHDGNNGDDYLSWLCSQWETEASQVVPQVRLAIIRISPVLSRVGGFLKPLFRALGVKVALKIGSATSCFSWIHMDDFVAAINFVITNKELSGVINLSAPGITTNDYMAQTLSEIMQARVTIRVPSKMVDMALASPSGCLCSSKAVYPAVLLEKGFKFQFPYIRAALESLAKKEFD